MATIFDVIVDTFARLGAAMQRPLHEPAPLPPPFSVYAYEEQIEANLRRVEEAKRTAAEPALLPSTDYRTNPRPAQTPVAEPAHYYPRPLAIAALTFQQPGWERVDGDRLTIVDAR